MEIVIIGTIRVLGSLPVLRWAFVGALIALVVDFSDLFLMNVLDLGGLGNYQRFDKYADLAYLLTFLAVAWRWQGLARNVAVALFAYRIVGFIAFEVTGERAVLLLFPNVFEFWFVFVASLPHWNPGFAFTRRQVMGWGALLLVAKECQEFVLHWGRWLDRFTFFEAVGAIWHWVTSPF